MNAQGISSTQLLDMAKRYGPARKLDSREAWEIESALEASANVTGPAKRVIDTWLISRAMKLYPRFAGFRFFTKTSAWRDYSIVSYHHPARLCWSWSLSISFGKHGAYRWPYLFGFKGRNGWSVRVPFLFDLRFSKQNYDWMISRNVRNLLTFLCHAAVQEKREA